MTDRIEIAVAILCTSIPVVKPLILRFAPRLLLSSRDGSNGNTYHRHGATHTGQARRNSFALRSIKVTHDIHQVEDDVLDSRSMQYGLQQPDVSLGFDYEKSPQVMTSTTGAGDSDENLVDRTASQTSSQNNVANPDGGKKSKP